MSIKGKSAIKVAVLTVTLLNAVLVMLGYNPLPFSEEFLYELFSGLAVVLIPAFTSYKNTDLTDEGVAGTAVTKALKGKDLTPEEQVALSEVRAKI